MKPLNETILENLRAELALSIANHKRMRTAYLEAEIMKLEKEIKGKFDLHQAIGRRTL